LLVEIADFVLSMVPNGKSPLTPLAQDTLDALTTAVPSEGELTYEKASAALAGEENLERPAVEDILNDSTCGGISMRLRKRL
jgi:hypothetical protein